MKRVRSRKALTVGENEIAQIVADWTKIPVNRLTETETQRLQKLEKYYTSASLRRRKQLRR